MKKVNVLIKNQHQLELLEDANKGDYIDLTDVMEVNTDLIVKQIEDKKDLIYEQKLASVIELERLKHDQILQEKMSELNQDKSKLENEIKAIEMKIKSEMTISHNKELSELENKINLLNQKNASEKLEIQNEMKNLHSNEISKLESEKHLIKQNIELEKLMIKNEYNNIINTNNQQINELKTKLESSDKTLEINELKIRKEYEDEMNELQKVIDKLKRDRSRLTVKDIGESLEVWCDNEFNANNLVLPQNILWQKDNEVVKNGKADFIYKVYANDDRNEDDLLTSVILEMKSEDPLAKSKQNVDTILKKLNEDRINKNIEYAILVSEIDWKDNNDVPIRKVHDYDKMFIVRPPYFITLLHIITSFGLKYKEILLTDNAERIKFKDANDILKEFEQMKEDILDLSLKYIENNVDIIIKESNNITNANEKLLKSANTILESHLITVKNKINGFKINRINQKISDL